MFLSVNGKIDFPDWLEAELKARGWSQSDLARAADVSRAAISKTLNRTSFPSPELCLAIAKAFNLPPAEVLQRAGILPPDKELAERTNRMIHIFEQLTPDAQEMYIAMAQSTVDLRKPGAQTRPRES